LPALVFALQCLSVALAMAADPEIDNLLRSPVGKDRVTNGGHLINQGR
jgi:hypothetical protein